MAMHYQGSSEIQSDGLQTLYLMNPIYLPSYPETQNQAQPNTPFFNPLHAPPIPIVPPHAPPPQQFMCTPLSHDPSRPSPSQEDAIPCFSHYNIWGGLADHHYHHHHHHQSDYRNLGHPTTPQQQQQTPKGLSLSLTPHQTWFDKSNIHNDDHDHEYQGQIISLKNCLSRNITTTTTSDHQINGVNNSVHSVIMGSKYLKAAHELLYEVVSVGKWIKNDRHEGSKDKTTIIRGSFCKNVDQWSEGGDNGNSNGGIELTIAQRQEIQMKKDRLNSMLDEVEQRYKQYHHQMQIIVTSFEQIAGTGSSKSYTHLTMRTILRQFRCLKNTISAQINGLNKSLGEEENAGKKMDGSRLKSVDRHLQQIGMTQWRPQRGLPERAVSVLRAWLFEHFLHPYPKDSDKHMLARQTGLTKGQVSNWFINARVRVWKPMVEDMYMEEIKNQEINPDDNNTTKPGIETRPDKESSNSKPDPPQAITTNNLNVLQSMQNNIPTLNLDSMSPSGKNRQNPPEKNPKKPGTGKNQDYSPSNILSVDMETRPGFSMTNYLRSGTVLRSPEISWARGKKKFGALKIGFQRTFGCLSPSGVPVSTSNFF